MVLWVVFGAVFRGCTVIFLGLNLDDRGLGLNIGLKSSQNGWKWVPINKIGYLRPKETLAGPILVIFGL